MLCRCSGGRYGAFLRGRKGRRHLQRCCRGSFLFAANGWDAPLDSTLPATGHGLLALDKPKAVGSTGKN